MALCSRPFISKYKLTGPEGLDLYFKGNEIKRVFATEADFMSIIVPIGWAYHHDFQAPPIGGSQAFPRWLLERVEANGSGIILGRGVSRIEVEKVMMVKRHTKPTQKNPQGGIQDIEGTVAIANVALWCEGCSAARRSKVAVDDKGRKGRVCVKCSAAFPNPGM